MTARTVTDEVIERSAVVTTWCGNSDWQDEEVDRRDDRYVHPEPIRLFDEGLSDAFDYRSDVLDFDLATRCRARCGRRSCKRDRWRRAGVKRVEGCSMQDELCGFVDLDEVVGIVWEVVRKLKLQPLRKCATRDRVGTLERKARLCSAADRRCFAPKESGDGVETGDNSRQGRLEKERRGRDLSPTNLSISATDHLRSSSAPG